ncbi:hypothetical protein [Brevibacterium casei]|uniref:Uncharacterized protein n=1 Tax=Brevibacterium casei TaxID=33889 RepID=A0A7T2TGM6_9MICO|nr:hypothetical protein [Brevibacterium casei]QPS33547.1 hypothetical protein I6G59_16725 [Brevibacterium casei]
MSYLLRPPISGLDDLSEESRIIATPWSRIVRGIGLGQHPIGYDPETAQLIERSATMLRDKLDGAAPYTTFSTALINLILATVRPGADDMEHHLAETTTALRAITNPYSRAIAGTILLDATAKLHLDLGEGTVTLGHEILDAVDQIQPDAIQDENQGRHGDYERVSALTAVFLAFNRAGLTDLLTGEARDRVSEALTALENVPTPFFRGRGGSMLIASISLVGRSDALTAHSTVESVLSWMDRLDEIQLYPAFPSPMSQAFIKAYPLLTMLNTFGTLDDPDRFVNTGRNRLQEASELMAELKPVERTHMALYYVMALKNLDQLDTYLPDLDSFVEQVVGQWPEIDPGRDYFLYGISYAYLIQLAYFAGRADLITGAMIDRMLGAFRALEATPEDRANRPYPFSYALNVLTELGLGELIHTPHPDYDDQSPYTWVIEQLSDGGHEEVGRLYMLNHALISWALRLRTPDQQAERSPFDDPSTK